MKGLTVLWHDLSPALRRYYRDSVLPSVVFLALVVVHEHVAGRDDVARALRAAAALAPVLAMAWMFAAYLRFLRDCDELERRIELGALAWAAGICMHVVLALLFLIDARVVGWRSDHAVAVIGVVLMASYALVRAWLHRRYA
jgi:hypothetical protein